MIETEEKLKVIRKKIVSIKPYLDGKSSNMGLSNYNEVLFPGASYNEQLTCLESNGVKRYVSGLDEFAQEVQKIQDKEQKAAKILQIRKNVIFLERAFNANDNISIEDEKFWDKVITVHPKNEKFWDKVFMLCTNEPVFLDPEDPNDFVKICCIEANGFSSIAPSLEDARRSSIAPKFYLDREIETASTKVEMKKIKNKAIQNLQNLSTNTKKMFYVAKVIDPKSYRYTNSTPSDVIYDYLDSYITGQGHETSAKRAADDFNKAFAMDLEDLKIQAVVNDAVFYKFIEKRPDGMQYHRVTNSMLGRNMKEIVEYLKNAMNAKLWEEVLGQVEKYWKA